MATNVKSFALSKATFASQAIEQAKLALGDAAPKSLDAAQKSLASLASDLGDKRLQ